jgi:hypothetical protein
MDMNSPSGIWIWSQTPKAMGTELGVEAMRRCRGLSCSYLGPALPVISSGAGSVLAGHPPQVKKKNDLAVLSTKRAAVPTRSSHAPMD